MPTPTSPSRPTRGRRASPSRWGEAIPRIERIDGFDVWVIAGKPWAKPGNTAMAGFDGVLPDGPATYEDMHPAAYDPKARIAFMDEQHIYAQVLYPNIGGFGGGSWLGYGDPAFALECVQAYNDFQVDFASVAPDRLLPIVSLPFWDVDADRRRDRALRRQRPPRDQLLQPARGATTSRRSGTGTGIRSGPRRRTPESRSTSTSAAGGSASSWPTVARWDGGRTSRGRRRCSSSTTCAASPT